MYIEWIYYTNHLNLFWSIYSWNQDRLNQKPKTNIKTWNVCVLWTWAYHTILIFTHGSKTQTKLGTDVFLTNFVFKPTRSKCRDPPSLTPTSAIYDLDARALESPCERLQNSFVEANHQLISWLMIWN